jgi:quercetin dioxygenase-like cupin family protein
MEIVRFAFGAAEKIGPRPYDVRLTSVIEFAEGAGEAHAYVIHFEPGGEIGAHEAGFKIFFAAAGSGWVAGVDGERLALPEGAAALVHRGEVHSKGSETGMTALMVQVRDLNRVA